MLRTELRSKRGKLQMQYLSKEDKIQIALGTKRYCPLCNRAKDLNDFYAWSVKTAYEKMCKGCTDSCKVNPMDTRTKEIIISLEL